MEIENAIYWDLESFRKERFFKMAVGEFWIFAWKWSKNILKWMYRSSNVLNSIYIYSFYYL